MKFSFFSIRQKFNYDNVNFGVDPPPLLEKVQILIFFFWKASLIDVLGGQAILLVTPKMGRKDRKNLIEPVCLHSPLKQVSVRCFMLD